MNSLQNYKASVVKSMIAKEGSPVEVNTFFVLFFLKVNGLYYLSPTASFRIL